MFCPQCGNPISHDAGKHETTDGGEQTAQTQALHTVATADDASPSQHSQIATPQAVHSPPEPAAHASVVENVRERVEKIRHVSSVVIDQAAYDPSLRFLLVAAALFLLFVVLVILSKVVG